MLSDNSLLANRPVAFWSGEKLLKNRSVIDGFDADQIDANAYNFRMGDRYFVTGDGGADGRQTKVLLTQGEPFLIPPGQFAYLLSKERFALPPNAMAFISMRTGVKFQGLINISGFHVDPGYKGNLIFAAFNASPSPIQICEGDPIFKIWFADLDRTSEEEYLFKGGGQGDISNNLIRGMSKELYSLQSLTIKMQTLEQNVDRKLAEQKPVISNLTSLWSAISTGVVIAILASLFVFILPLLMAGGSWLEKRFVGEEPSIEVNASEEGVE